MGLLRLATYAILGYAAYTVISDLMQSQGGRSGRESGQGRQGRGQRDRGSAARMSGPAGEQGGRIEQTEGADGGSTPTRVGRGVIST